MREDFPANFHTALLALFSFRHHLQKPNQTMEDKGHLVTRHVNVWLELRLVECFRDTLNKRANVKNHRQALSRRQGGISSDPHFRTW